MLTWVTQTLEQCSSTQLLQIMMLRSDVFVVEQQCIYPDPDSFDFMAHHCCGYIENNIVAYARILPPASRFPEPSIGRVVTHPLHRKIGLGKKLMEYSIEQCFQHYPNTSIHISAQSYLTKFYQDLGFTITSLPYNEDGILHIEMMLYHH